MKRILVYSFILTILPAEYSYCQWTQNGPYGGKIPAIASVGTSLFAGGSCGIFMSNDTGRHWVAVDRSVSVTSLITIDTVLFALNGNRISRTKNYGQTWEEIVSSSTNEGSITDMVANKTTLFVGYSKSGIRYSTDNGTTWTVPLGTGLVKNNDGKINIYSFAVEDSNWYAATETGLFYSHNHGSNWKSISAVNLPNNVIFKKVAVAGKNLLVSSYNLGEYCLVKNDTGWTLADERLPGSGPQLISIVADKIIASTDNGLYISEDSGSTWIQGGAGLSSSLYSAISFGNTLWGGSYSGLFVSTDGGFTWASSHNGISCGQFNAVAVRDSIVMLAGGVRAIDGHGSNDGGYRSTDNGTTWDSCPVITRLNPLTPIDNDIYGGTWQSGPWKSTDNGSIWVACTTGIPRMTTVTSFLKFNNTIFIGTGASYQASGIFRSDNNGLRWDSVSVHFPDSTYVQALCASGTDIFAAVNYVKGWLGAGIYRSTDAGQSWDSVNTGLPLKSFISKNGRQQNTALVAIGNNIISATDGVYLTTNHGGEWKRVGTLYGVRCFNVYGNTVFAGNSQGIYFSPDSGRTWNQISTALPFKASINNLVADGNYLFAATETHGLWRCNVSELMPVKRIHLTYLNHRIHLRYSKVNGSIVFSVTSSTPSQTQFLLFTLLGQKVSGSTRTEKPCRTDFSCKGLRPGSYVYRIITNELPNGKTGTISIF